jgi:dipeptidyl-peptidase-4
MKDESANLGPPAASATKLLEIDPATGQTAVRLERGCCGSQPGPVRIDSLDSLSERAELAPRPATFVLGPRRLRAMLFLPSWHRPGGGQLLVLADPHEGWADIR